MTERQKEKKPRSGNTHERGITARDGAGEYRKGDGGRTRGEAERGEQTNGARSQKGGHREGTEGEHKRERPKGTERGAREIRVSCPRTERAVPPYTRRSAGGYTGAPHLIYVTKYTCIYLYICMYIYMYIYIAAWDV